MIPLKNKRGNIYFGFGMGIFIFIMGVLFLPFITDDIDSSRTNLDCANPSLISDGTKLICLGISGIVPYFIWFFISVSLGYIIGVKT